jgi:MoaA/NifB/PqqE/SkfB family radical SAM enzyme
MVSNGTLIKPPHLDLLARLDCLTISVDGLGEVHDHIRQRPGTFARTEKTIRWLADRRDITWGTNTVMQKDNAHQLYDVFRHFKDIGGLRYAYVNYSHCELTPDIAHLGMSIEQQRSAHAQLRRVADDCERTHTWFSQRDLLLEHFDVYADKTLRYRPVDGCKIPQRFLGYSEHGFYPCWHQGRNIRADSLVEALESPLARDIVREGLERRCVGCNAFNYAWDDEWNAGILASARSGLGVEHGIVPLRIPARDSKLEDDRRRGRRGAYIDLHDE